VNDERAELSIADLSNRLYCNNCGGYVEFRERGITPFGGRFCSQDCKNDFDLKETRNIMGQRR